MTNQSKLTFEDRKYNLVKMPPTKAAPFGARVAKIVAAALSEGAALTEQDEAGMLKVFTEALQRIDPAEFTDLMMDALSYEVHAATLDGKTSEKLNNQVAFNAWFQEYPGDMYPVGIWAVWEHSKDFLFGAAPAFKQIVGDLGLMTKAADPDKVAELPLKSRKVTG